MVLDEWTQLVQRVDKLIRELQAARIEARKWKARVLELESVHGNPGQMQILELQAKERELERYRKDYKKITVMVSKLISELEKAEEQCREQANE